MLGLLHLLADRLLRLMEDAEDALWLWDDPLLDEPGRSLPPRRGDDPLLAA